MKLRIGCTDWEVVFEDKPIADQELCRGYIDNDTRRIFLANNLSDTRLMETFLHESLHAIDDEYRLGLSENQVNILGNSIIAFIRTNKINFLA